MLVLIYESVRDYIKDAGIKYTFIADKTGMKVNVISMIMQGKRKLGADEFVTICGALHVPPDKFLSAR